MSTKSIVSIDAGNGAVKAVYQAPGKSSYRPFYMPSIRTRVTPDSLNLGRFEQSHTYYTWHNSTYAAGHDVLKMFSPKIERHMGTARYTGEMFKFLIAVALANLGVKSGKVDLTLFCPPKLFNEAAPQIMESFKEPLTIQMGETAYLWECSVRVWPEGFGAAAMLFLDKAGREVSSDLLTGNTLLVDLGAFTVDTLIFSHGEIDIAHLNHSSYTDMGTHRHILSPILSDLQKADKDFRAIDTDHVDTFLIMGMAEGGKQFTAKVGNKEADISPKVAHYVGTYANALANLLTSDFSSLEGINHVVLCGGGAVLVEPYLRAYFGDKVVNPAQYPHVKNVSVGDYNAVGGLRLALMGE